MISVTFFFLQGLVIQEGGVANYMERTAKNYANEPLLRNGSNHYNATALYFHMHFPDLISCMLSLYPFSRLTK